MRKWSLVLILAGILIFAAALSANAATFTDTVDNFNNMYSHTANLVIDNTNPGYFENDTGRVKRAADTVENIVYNKTNITGFSVRLYYFGTLGTEFAAYASANNSTWTTLSITKDTAVATGAGWYRVNYSLSGTMPSGTNYIKFEMKNDPNGWCPQIGYVEVYYGGSGNLALNKTASASTALSGYPAGYANDSSASTRWCALDGAMPQWWRVDLGASYSISSTTITLAPSSASFAYQIGVSTDGANYTTVVNKTSFYYSGTQTDNFTAITARYVRVYFTGSGTGDWASLSDVQVFGSSSPTPTPPSGNLALNKSVTASSVEATGLEANKAVDGNTSTRWSSAYSDPQWIYVDMGNTYSIDHVRLNWESAYAKSYSIQVSTNASTWTNVYSTTTGDGGIDDIAFNVTTARYVRMYGTVRGTVYGYSLWEFEIYNGNPPPTPTPTPGGAKRVVGYLPTWSGFNYNNIDFNIVTCVNIAFANPDANGNLYADISNSQISACAARAHSFGRKCVICIGGAGADCNYSMWLDASHRGAFADKCLQYVIANGLDGIDVDLEDISYDPATWGPFIRELRTRFSAQGKIVTSALADWQANGLNGADINQLDYLNIMAYDYVTDGSAQHSSYQYAVDCLNYFANKGVPKDKLVLGVPFYGYAPGINGISFGSIISQYGSAAYNVDYYAGIYYNGAATIKNKTLLANGYGGVMIWELSQDASGSYSLLSVIGANISR